MLIFLRLPKQIDTCISVGRNDIVIIIANANRQGSTDYGFGFGGDFESACSPMIINAICPV